MSATAEQLARAYEQGKIAAENAASWLEIVDDDHAHELVKLIENGDPRLDEQLPMQPTLSGEWAGDPTPKSLAADIIGGDTWLRVDPNELSATIDALAQEWERGVSEHFQPTCERRLLEYLAS